MVRCFVKIICTILDIIAPCVVIIFNECITSSEFPNLMGYSKVIPLFNSGPHKGPTNNWPVYILLTNSKLF